MKRYQIQISRPFKGLDKCWIVEKDDGTRWVSLRQAAQLIGCSIGTLHNKVDAKNVIRIGYTPWAKSIRKAIPIEEVVRLLPEEVESEAMQLLEPKRLTFPEEAIVDSSEREPTVSSEAPEEPLKRSRTSPPRKDGKEIELIEVREPPSIADQLNMQLEKCLSDMRIILVSHQKLLESKLQEEHNARMKRGREELAEKLDQFFK